MSDNGVCSIGPSVKFQALPYRHGLTRGPVEEFVRLVDTGVEKKLFISFPAMPPKPSADLPYTVTQKPFTQIGNSFRAALRLASDNWSALFLVAWQRLGSQKSPSKHKLTGLARAKAGNVPQPRKTYHNPVYRPRIRDRSHPGEVTVGSLTEDGKQKE